VVVAGGFGKGRVVFSGMLTGLASKTYGACATVDRAPEGDEWTVLLNSVQWVLRQSQKRVTSK